jgi:acetolactate synthase-1/2/3 large subunit
MNNSHTGYDPAQFAPQAKKIYIDIDPSELNKDVGIKYDVRVEADLRDFFNQEQFDLNDHADWLHKTLEWKNRWPVFDPVYKDSSQGLNLYAVLEQINIDSDTDAILMADAGSSSYACPVALRAKSNQNFVMTPAQADMGWSLPAAIGAKISNPERQVIAVTGDGSFMSNLQELATVKNHELNIKYVVLNNGGYLSIKNTQTKYYDKRVWGTDTDTGLWFPHLADVALAFGFDYVLIPSYDTLQTSMKAALDSPRPTIIDCICLHEQEILPTQGLKEIAGKKVQAGLHDLYPFLAKEELDKEMYWNI